MWEKSSNYSKKNHKICILTSVHPAFDGRIFHKEAKTLAKAGYNVILIAKHDNEKIINGVRIIPLPKHKNRFERMTKIMWKLFRLALKEKADIYHFHDPELIFIGLLLRLYGKKVIYDVHEDVSKLILNKDWVGNIYNRKCIAFIVYIIEQIGAFLYNGIVAATPDIAKKFPKNKTVILRNFPILELVDDAKPINYKKDKSVIIYAGGLDRTGGIMEIIQAMKYINNKAEPLLLGKWESKKFRYECENLEGWNKARYLGFISLNEVFQYMKIADIGLCLLYPIKNYITSLPIKIFEYMACSLPLVISNFPYWKKAFKGCALFANPYDPEEIAEKILYLLDNPDIMKKISEKGRKLIEEKCNWETESKKLIKQYNSLLEEKELE